MYHIIINPASRSGKGLKLWNEIIEPALRREGVDYRPYFSQKAGDVERLTREITAAAGSEKGAESDGLTAAAESDRLDAAAKSGGNSDAAPLTLLILGGDGTINEALQGLSDPSHVLLGYIPTGSSNDLARDLKLPRDPQKALERVLHPSGVHRMDMGVLHTPDGKTRRFADSCGIGFDAAVCEGVSCSKMKAVFNKIGLGKLIYLAIALKQLFTAGSASCELSLDGKEPLIIDRILFNACMIHRFEGGGFRFCPDANDHDGILNLCTVGNIPRLLILCALPTAFFGRHYLFRGVDAHSARRVEIRTSMPLCVHTDGEVWGHFSEITVECIPDALRIIS